MSEIRDLLINVTVDEPAGLVELNLEDFERLEAHIKVLESQVNATERDVEERVIHRLKMDMRNRDIWIGMTGNMFIARRLTRTSPTEYSTTGRAEVELSPFDAIRKLVEQEQS